MFRPSALRRAMVLLTVVGALAACGDSSASGASTSDASASTAPSDSVPADGQPAAGADSEFCSLNAELNAAPSPYGEADATAVDVGNYFHGIVTDQLAKMGAVAPAEVSADFAVLVAGISELADALVAKGDVQITDAMRNELSATLDGPEFQAAGAAIDAYCGIG